MFIRSSKESLKSRNLSFLAKDRMDNLLKAQALSERAVAVIGNSESSLAQAEFRPAGGSRVALVTAVGGWRAPASLLAKAKAICKR